MPAGSSVDMEFLNPADPANKPHSVDVIVFRTPPGTQFDFGALPQCTATDAELMARGAAACPPGSEFQTGHVAMDTGSPALFPRWVSIRTATFVGRDELVSIGDAENFPFRGVVRSPVRGNTITVDYSDMPGNPPPDNYAAMKTMFTAGPPRVRGDRTFMRTPPTCPTTGHWTNHYTVIYNDGVIQTETTRAPCRRTSDRPATRRTGGDRGRHRRPVLVVSRPSASARLLNRRSAIGIALRVDGLVRNVRARLIDRRTGRIIAGTTARRLRRDTKLTLRARRRATPGPHRVVVLATDRQGRRLRASRAVRLRR